MYKTPNKVCMYVCIHSLRTLGARGFSCAVSGVGHISIVTRAASSLVPSACGRRSEASLRSKRFRGLGSKERPRNGILPARNWVENQNKKEGVGEGKEGNSTSPAHVPRPLPPLFSCDNSLLLNSTETLATQAKAKRKMFVRRGREKTSGTQGTVCETHVLASFSRHAVQCYAHIFV